MDERPYVVLSWAMSVDGYIDDASRQRLVLSNADDLDQVDELRASVDAIMVGANTVRRDDPRLLVRSPERRAAHGTPIKVTLTRDGDLDPAARFFTSGDVQKIVYCAGPGVAECRDRLGHLATVAAAETPEAVVEDLAARGVRRLMVEGGTDVLAQFLSSGLADELRIAIAPIFVADPRAPRAPTPTTPPSMALAEVERLGEVVVLRYVRR